MYRYVFHQSKEYLFTYKNVTIFIYYLLPLKSDLLLQLLYYIGITNVFTFKYLYYTILKYIFTI